MQAPTVSKRNSCKRNSSARDGNIYMSTIKRDFKLHDPTGIECVPRNITWMHTKQKLRLFALHLFICLMGLQTNVPKTNTYVNWSVHLESTLNHIMVSESDCWGLHLNNSFLFNQDLLTRAKVDGAWIMGYRLIMTVDLNNGLPFNHDCWLKGRFADKGWKIQKQQQHKNLT